MMKTEGAKVGEEEFRYETEVFDGQSLLRTKLYMPPLRPNLIPRARLIDPLNSNPEARLILISAPAGFGKTTIVAEWLARLQASTDLRHAAWLSLEEADNNLGRFWRYIIAAYQTVDPSIGRRIMAMLRHPPLPPAETWLAALLHDLEQVDKPIILVLDDYHVIHTRAIHQSLNYLLQHLPPHARLALVTRADPPLPLARLRVQDELVELRAADLQFTLQEVETYLNQAMELRLAPEDIERLGRRTEGWPAGMHLAARSLLGYEAVDRPEFIRSFSGSNHFVLNYLLEEVLQQQQPAVRDFLLQTSVLSRLSGPLCAAVTDQPLDVAENTLSRLAHDHLFVIPLDDEGRWFRYHSLFAEALETRLREKNVEMWNEIHRKASAWCAHNGHVERAISHALACAKYDTAAELIESVGDKIWTGGDITAPLRWLDSIPLALVEERMALRLLYIWLLFLHDRWHDATHQWEKTGELLDSQPSQPTSQSDLYRGSWAAIGGAMSAHRLLPEETVRMAQQALALLPAEDTVWRAIAQLDLGLAYQAQGNATQAAAIYRTMVEQCIDQNNLYLAFAALAHLNEVCYAQGRLYESQAICERMQELEDRPGGRLLALHANGNIGLGRLAYERNDLLTAERLLADAVGHLWPGGQPRMVLVGRVTLSRIYENQGEAKAARWQLDQALEMVTHLRMTVEEKELRACQARLALNQGRWDDVHSWQETTGLLPQDFPDVRHELEYSVLAEILIAEGKYNLAEVLMARLRAAAERSGRAGSDINLTLRYALSLAGQKRWPEAEVAARHALSLAQPQGYVRTFLDLGLPMMELLERSPVRRQSITYVDQLLLAFAAESRVGSEKGTNGRYRTALPEDGEGIDGASLLEELTPREWEILTMIARGAPNQEIADQLVLSVGTVKGHVNHIFSKLDVHNRTAAVARARELGIIST